MQEYIYFEKKKKLSVNYKKVLQLKSLPKIVFKKSKK